MTITTIAADARARSKSPVDERFNAANSALGPLSPAAISALAFSDRFRVLRERAHDQRGRDAQRTIAAITQPSHGGNATRRIASQIPKPNARPRPTTTAAVPTIATR